MLNEMTPKIKAVQKMQDYIAAHQMEEINLSIWKSKKKYDPSVVGYKWDKENPRIQLEPHGECDYIELVAVKAQ